MSDNVRELVNRLLEGDRRAAARLITLVEEGASTAREVVEAIHPYTGHAYIVGITGLPGSGKSTLLDKLITLARREGLKVGVIAVDPTSPFTGGAILGDRIRMQRHSTDQGVFIRSMATRGSLGGLARATDDAVKVLDAYGCDVIFVETVGVGQTEVDIVKTADTVVLVTVPGLGDDVQAIKAGLMEIADVFVINKADREGVEMTYMEIRMAIEFERERWEKSGWEPPIVSTVAFTLSGVRPLWEAIKKHEEFLKSSGKLMEKRRKRVEEEVKRIAIGKVREAMESRLMDEDISSVVNAVLERKIGPYSAADVLMRKAGITV